MKSKKIKIVVSAVWLLFALVFVVNFRVGNEIASAQTKNKQIIKEIEGYKNWTKVNSAPVLMPERVA